VAEPVVTDVVTDAILELIERAKPGARERLMEVVNWLGDFGQPPPGIELFAPDGRKYTGVALVIQGEVELLFAVAPLGPRRSRATNLAQPTQTNVRVQPGLVRLDDLLPLSARDDDPDRRR
jgi:hypothetical protein